MYVNPSNKKNYIALILLNLMVDPDPDTNEVRRFKVVADNPGDKMLDPVFQDLFNQGYITASGIYYEVTDKGFTVLDNFMKRFREFNKLFDVFSYVNLEQGTFAFSKFFDFETDDEWKKFLTVNQSQYEDMRIAVAIFKQKMDPAELVFMSFINEKRFDTVSPGWQINLLTGAIWEEIEQICETAIKPTTEGIDEEVMVNVINSGTALAMQLLEEENRRNKERAAYEAEQERLRQEEQQSEATESTAVTEEVVEEYIEEYDVAYYDPYYDPYYVSPIWLLPLILW